MTMKRHLFVVVGAVVCVVFTASPAWAHGNINADDFYTGMLHPVLHVEHILSILALGFWCGQIGQRATWIAPLVFVGSVVMGAVLGLLSVALPLADIIIYLSMVMLGLVVAARLVLNVWVIAPIVLIFGICHGWAHGAGMVGELEKPATYVVGLGLGVSLLLFYSVQLVVRFKAQWMQVAVRIAGSWITATGLMVLALRFR